MADTERKPHPHKRKSVVEAGSLETPKATTKVRRSRKADPAKAVTTTPAGQPPIAGRKGGSEKVHAPVEAPDSVRSVARAKMLFALGEGEYAGNLDGRRIQLDGTPLIGADGTENFPGVKWEFRPGTQHQEYIPGLPAVENETSVGVELRSDTPWVKDLTNPELSAARLRLSWPSLQERKDNGDVVGYRIDYAIDLSVDGGLWKEVLSATLNDKTTTKYERSHRIDLPKSATGWSLRVRRLTPNTQKTNNISDIMRVEAVTEVIDAKLRYPNTALLYIEFDSSQFQSIPKVSCEPDMRIIRVPTNYDPATRAYSGIWDGTFKWAWTDNPAWVLYDIILNKRFGMGRRLDMAKVDRWELYEIARYCDELVSDGKGGQEPRFTCNVYIQKRADAWTVLRDIAAIFRGITYWSGSEMVVQADKPSDVEFVFSRSNVLDGKFSYDAQSERTRYSSALVSWDNPDNAYESQPQPVSIPALIRRYNFNQTEITAIGCTRQSEADRRGRWMLLTNSVDRGVKFSTGLEGYLPKPGRIIGVADALLAGRQLGGRISSATARQVKVDRDVQVKAGDRLIANLPSGKAEARTVSAVSGRSVTVTADFSEVPKAQAQWGLESSDLVIQQYRVTKVSRSDNGFEITGVMNDPGKYDQVDSGSRLESQPISVIPARTQQAPTGVTVSSYTRTEQGLAVTTLRADWQAAPGAIAYVAEWRKDSGAWIAAARTSGLGFEVPGIYAGRYTVRVRAVNALEVSSLPAYSPETVLNGKEGAPPTVATFTVTPLPWGMGLAWTFPDGADDTRYTEIEQNTAATDENAALLGLYPYPQRSYELSGLAGGVSKHFRARLVDTSGNAGPWTNWVLGTSSSDPSDYLPLITEEIVHSALGEELLSRIDKIDMDGPGSVNERVGEVRNQLNEQVAEVNTAIETVKSSVTDARNELQQQLAAVDQEVDAARSELQQQINTVSALAGSLPYNKDKAYALNQGVLGPDGKLYQALKAVPKNNPPPNATYWIDVGQAIVTAAGTAARVGKVETDVSTLNGTSTAQASKIEGLQSGLTTTNGNVTAAQQAAQAAATAAGAKGEVIYGTTAPAADKRLAQNLWIDTTGNANTPKRWNGSTWVAVTDKVATDASAAATNALAVAQTKADAQAVQSVTTRVTDVEGAVSAQGQAMTGLQSSLTTTKQDVTAAQQAAQAAATAAGAKGEVIYGSTAPAVADRLAQNLWIDTTGNANTPKRWTGSAWVAVTDKAATDAAAAAASALALAQTKADASVVSNLSTLVTDAEGKLTSQATRMDGMQTSINGKASSEALQQVTSRVTATEQKDTAQDQQISSQSSAITSLNDSVSKKADASTVQALSNEVKQQGQGITAQGQALTRIDAALPNVGGENILYNPSFERAGAGSTLADGWVQGGSASAVLSLVDSTLDPGGKAQRIVVSGLVVSPEKYSEISTANTKRPSASEGQNVVSSIHVRGTVGLKVQLYIQAISSQSTPLATTTGPHIDLTGEWQRISLPTEVVFPAGTITAHFIYRVRAGSLTEGFVEFDRAQAQVGTVASGWQDNGQVNAADVLANATATTVLTGRVEKAEQGLTSTSSQVTQLTGKLDTTNQSVTNAQQAAQAAAELAGSKGKVIVQSGAPAAGDRQSQNLWLDTSTGTTTPSPKRWSGSAWVSATDKVASDAAAAAQSALTEVAKKADASTVQALSNTVSQQGQDLTAAGQSLTNINAAISQVGSENLLVNPSFDRESTVVSGLAASWVAASSNSLAFSRSLVPSTLDPAGLAQRIDSTNLNSANNYVDLQPSVNVPIGASQVVSQSAFFKATAGFYVRLYLQPQNAAGVTLETHTSGALYATGEWQRMPFEGRKMPVDTVSVRVLFRVFGASSAAQGGAIEWDRAQLEIGGAVSGWRDNGSLSRSDVVANAAATAALTGRVTQAETGLTSVSGQVTELNNSIGDVGGENLFYNPAFTTFDSLNGSAEGWEAEGPIVSTDTLVTSWLNSGEKAQRIVAPGLTNSGQYKSLRPSQVRRIKVGSGQAVTASIYARKNDSDVGLRFFIQWINAAGAVISSPNSLLTPLTIAGSRPSFSAVAPSGAAEAYVYFRVYAMTATSTNGTVELARPQAEYGTKATGWRDNGQVNAASNSATSAAVDSLTSTVSQQGTILSSVAGRTTSLENSLTTTNGNVTAAQQAAEAASALAGGKGKVLIQSAAPAVADRLAQNLWIDTTGNANTPKRWTGSAWVAVTDKAATDAAAAAQSALSQVATKAEASAVQALTNRVTVVEGVNTSQSSSLTDLNNSVGAIQSSLGASGLDPAPDSLWQFDTTTEGWAVNNATLTQGAGFIRITANSADPQLQNSAAISIPGALYNRVRLRITRRAGAVTDWDGQLFYQTAGHGFSGSYRAIAANPNLVIGQSAVVEWDMANLTAGGTDWIDSTILRLRLDLGGTSGGAFDVDWIAVGRVAPSASSRAVESLTSTVTQQGDRITSEAKRTDGLYTSMGSANAAIQNEATARANADSSLSQQIQNTQSSLGSTNVSLQQLSTAHASLDGKVNGTYTVKLQAVAGGQYVAAGFGLGLVNQGGMFQTTFAVYADRFAVLNAVGNGFVSPFAIQGGQVFMNDAFIRDASITNAKIADASISRAKIEDAAISAAKIGIAEVDTLRIRGNAVTVPVSANRSENVLGAGAGQWQNLIAVGVQMDEAGFITAQYSGYQGFGSGIRKYMFQMDINGLVIAQGGGDWADGFPNLMGSIGVGPGYFVITVKWWGENSGVGVQNHTLYAMGTKR